MIDLAPTDLTLDAILGAALVLKQRDNPLRPNLFAVAIRILLDHVMDALAPQAEVAACRWFKPVEGQDHPVRTAGLSYALIGGLTEDQVKTTGIDVKPLIKEVIAACSALNKHAWTRRYDRVVRR